MPNGAAPAGRAVGEVENSVRLPPLTVKPLSLSAPVPTTQSVLPSGLRRASSLPSPLVLNAVLPISVREPSWLIV